MRKLIVGLTLAFAFAMNATGQTEKILFKFTGGRDGGNPEGGLIFRGGNLYGTASTGGSYLSGCGGAGCGTVFELKHTTRLFFIVSQEAPMVALRRAALSLTKRVIFTGLLMKVVNLVARAQALRDAAWSLNCNP